MRHRDDAAGIHGIVWNSDLRRNASIVIAYEIPRVIVRDEGGRARCESIKNIVRIGSPLAVIEYVSDSQRRGTSGVVGNAFQNESMKTIIRVGMRTGETFIEEHGQPEVVG